MKSDGIGKLKSFSGNIQLENKFKKISALFYCRNKMQKFLSKKSENW